MGVMEACIRDKFSKDTFFGRNIGNDTCLKEYAALLRHRVEGLFPVEELEGLCTRQKTTRPTGEFWKYSHFYKHFDKFLVIIRDGLAHIQLIKCAFLR